MTLLQLSFNKDFHTSNNIIKSKHTQHSPLYKKTKYHKQVLLQKHILTCKRCVVVQYVPEVAKMVKYSFFKVRFESVDRACREEYRPYNVHCTKLAIGLVCWLIKINFGQF